MTLGETLVSIHRRLEERAQAVPVKQAAANPGMGSAGLLVDCEQVRPKLLHILTIDSHEESVRKAYRSLFNREPDPAGFHYYVEHLRLGFSKVAMLVELAESQEGRRAGVHVLATELRLRRCEHTDWRALERYEGAEFVCMLYRAILNIDPDSRSVARWAGLLERGLLSKREFFESFLQTNEAAMLSRPA
jgi:Domain of unknown function (DUF4214)